jgi:hypothetical protein
MDTPSPARGDGVRHEKKATGAQTRPCSWHNSGRARQSAYAPSARAGTLFPFSDPSVVSLSRVHPNCMVVPGARCMARWPRISLLSSKVPVALRRSSIYHPCPSNQIRACRLDTAVSGHRSTSRDEVFFPERPTRAGRSSGKNHVSCRCSP